MRSGRNFPPRCHQWNFPPRGHQWRRPRSATKPRRPSSLLSRQRELMLNGGPPSFIRFPRPIKCSSIAASSSSSTADVAAVVDGSVADYRSSTPSASQSADVASVVDDLDANFRLSTSSGSHSADIASAVDGGVDADYRSSVSPSSPAAVADSQLKYDVFISFRGPDSRDIL